jgi:HD-like signal output (HDOD) protein
MPPRTSQRSDISRENDAHEQARIFEYLTKLPVFSPSALQLLSVSTESDSAMEAFSEAFGSDPALAADLLVVVNLGVFAPRCHIETIRHALTFLGLDRVRSLASTIALKIAMRTSQRKEDVRTVWAHGIAAAVVAEELGTIHSVAGLYTAALMHDLGRLGLFLVAGSRYAEVLSGTFDDIEESNRLERTLFGIDHCQAGAMLGRTWNFPVGLQASMGAHHENVPPSAPQKLVQIACMAADFLGFPEVRRRDLELTAPVWEKTGLSLDHIREKITQRTVLLDG